MRKSASQIIRDLEMRVARLERQAGPRDRLLERANKGRSIANRASTLYEDMVDFCTNKMGGMPVSDCVRAFVARFKNTDENVLKSIAFTFFSSKTPLGREVQKTNGSLPAIAKALCKDPEAKMKRQANAIAATIVQQLGGGRKLQMFIGLKQLINERNGVTLVFPKPKHRGAVNRVRITLNGKDLYDMEFIRTHGRSVKVVKEFNDVYAEDLKDRFEEGTGLYIRF